MVKKQTYELALNELQTIIAEIENEEIGIDQLSVRVKRAAELLKYCQQKLRKTEDDVTKILNQFDDQ
jgi:exodeoxyribonuclease VII small subunit